MLLKAEKILTRGDQLIPNMSEDDILKMTRRELAEKITDELFTRGYVKTIIRYEVDTEKGPQVSVLSTVRVYHPDD